MRAFSKESGMGWHWPWVKGRRSGHAELIPSRWDIQNVKATLEALDVPLIDNPTHENEGYRLILIKGLVRSPSGTIVVPYLNLYPNRKEVQYGSEEGKPIILKQVTSVRTERGQVQIEGDYEDNPRVFTLTKEGKTLIANRSGSR